MGLMAELKSSSVISVTNSLQFSWVDISGSFALFVTQGCSYRNQSCSEKKKIHVINNK